MGKNANFVSHKKSKLKENGGPKLPLAADLVEGEIAINFGKDVETLSIKNESGDVVTFSSDNYYTEKKLGSGFTGENSGVTVTDVIGSGFTSSSITDVIIENEEIVSAALNDLDERKLDASAYTPSAAGLWVSGTGLNSVVQNGSSGTASGDYSVAEGVQTESSGQASHAEGGNTHANGNGSHAEGGGTLASGVVSHAEGSATIASGDASHSEGITTTANGQASHAEGVRTIASGTSSHSEGQNTTANGNYSHAEGNGTTANGIASHAEGSGVANGNYSHAEGESTSATSVSSHAEGRDTLASGDKSHAEGYQTLASGIESHAEGSYTVASGYSSHAEGSNTVASGYSSHAEGASTTTSGDYSHAEGGYTTAIGNYSHAEGSYAYAIGNYSHVEGSNTTASGNSSHAEGMNTIANNQSEHASGQYNVSNSASTTFGDSGNTLFSVGNGVYNARHNAFEIRQNGDIYIVSGGTDIKLQDYIGGGGSITVDQVIDDTTSASTNPVSTSAVYSAMTDNELVWANAYVVLSGAISSHTVDTDVHVTAADKEKLHTHNNKASLDSITGNVGTMAYENTSSYSSATEVNTALGDKLDTTAYTPSVELWVSGTGENAVAQKGGGNTASGNLSVAEGQSTTASGDYSHAEGSYTTASGDSSHSEGWFTTASGTSSHAEGYFTKANGYYSHAEGVSTRANGIQSHAEGGYTTAVGYRSHTEGSFTTANNDVEHASGQYNVSSSGSSTFGDSGNTLFSVGNGTADNARHNAFEIRQNGDIYITSGNSDIKLQDYIGSVETVTAITPSNSGSTDPIATKVVAENELTVSNALNDLNTNKADKTSDLDGLKLKKITQAAYDALTIKDPNTLYVIVN